MAFTGTGLVEEVSDSVVRVTGISLAPGAVGTIGLHDTLIPFHGLVPDVRLPPEFQPADYATVTLQASIQAWFNLVFTGGADLVVPVSLAKSGTTTRDFLIAITNTSDRGAGSFIGSSYPFGVLAAVAVNNTNVSGVTGDVGVWPGAIVTGFPPGTASGTIHTADATAQAAIHDATVGYTVIAAMTPTQDLSGQDLGGLVLTAGIYRFDADAALTGTLTLDFQNDPNVVFVIQVVGDLTTAAASTVSIINNPDPNRIFWTVGGDAVLGNTTDFRGTILAAGDIALTQSSSIIGGRAVSVNGTVNMTGTTVSIPTDSFFPADTGPLEVYVRFH